VLSSSPQENFRKFSTKTEEISTPAKINLCSPPRRGKTSGYAVLVEKVGLFLEKVGLFWKKPYFFQIVKF
jgi:hypothetical protein